MRNLRIMAIIALVIFSTFTALNNGFAARNFRKEYSSRPDPISRWEKRIQPVLRHIPEDVGVLGYVADWNVPGVEYDLVDQETEYTLTQYALAPRAVQPGLELEWIIGNFTKPDFRAWLDESLPSYEITEIGFGVYVIHRTSP